MMMSPIVLLNRGLQVAFISCALAGSAYGQTMPDIGHGEMVAARDCAGCHGVSGIRAGTVVQGILVPSFPEIARRSDRTQEMLEAVVMTPHWPMPALPLQSREIRDVVGYILSLK